MSASRFDRRVYLASHPVLFTVLALTRRWPSLRLGRTVLVHSTSAYVDALTHVPLDRTAPGTTGGAARAVDAAGLLFDQSGGAHRAARRSVAPDLGSAGVASLRPVWQAVLTQRLAPLTRPGAVAPIEVVGLATELAGATAAALLDSSADPLALAEAAREAAAATARAHLPGIRRPGTAARAHRAAAALTTLLAPDDTGASTARESGLAAMLAVAAVNTTVAALPRAAAWCAKAGWWDRALDPDPDARLAFAAELLRLTAPTPVLPRVAAGPGRVGGCPVRGGDRLLLVARHAARAHDPGRAVPAQTASLVFGAGPHACPGAALARAQLADALAALAIHRPVVGRAKADRHSALPGWRELWLHPTPRQEATGCG